MPLQIVLKPPNGDATVMNYRLKARPPPKNLKLGSEVAPVLVPFWVLASAPAKGAEPRASDGSAAVPLAYRTADLTLPVFPRLVKGLKSGPIKDQIVYRTLYATNLTRLNKGDVVVLREPPPDTLDSTE